MILKVFDELTGGWVYFDHIEKLSMFRRGPHGPNVPQPDFAGGVYIKDLKEVHMEIGFTRMWGSWDQGSHLSIACDEAFLLGDDGKTIERL